jgi:hypothetical protein
MSECCANCRFLVVREPSWECRRHAPVIAFPEDDPRDRGWWPQVEHDEWCGEWEPRPAR